MKFDGYFTFVKDRSN